MAQQKQIHMSLEDRKFIEECLNAGIKKNQIALRLGKDKSTVTKEIRKRSRIEPGISSDDSQDGSEKPVFAEACSRRDVLFGVCNGCSHLEHCQNDKRLYIAVEAHQNYTDRMSGHAAASTYQTRERNKSARLLRKALSRECV